MANDINDILGINLPPEQPSSKGKIISDLIQNLVFSLGQGYAAQGTARGPQARAAGIGAALQGPMVRQQILQQQQNEAQDRAIKIQQLRQAALRGDQDAVLKLRDALQGSVAPEVQIPAAPVMPSDVGGGGAGLQPQGTRQVAMPLPTLQYPTGGGQSIPLTSTSAQQGQEMGLNALRQQEQIKSEFAKPQLDTAPFGYNNTGLYEKTTGRIIRQPEKPPEKTDQSIVPFDIWRQQHPNGKIEDWIALNRAPKETPDLPTLDDAIETTASGNRYVNASKWTGNARNAITTMATKGHVPVVSQQDAKQLTNLDAARSDADYMLAQLNSKLATDPKTRVTTGLGNVISKFAQNDDVLAAVGTFKSAAIRQIQALGATGRVNQKLIDVAIQNDIPQITDTVGAAKQKVANLKKFFDDAENAILKPKPAASKNPYR